MSPELLLLGLVQQHRAAQGLPALKLDPSLTDLARVQAALPLLRARVSSFFRPPRLLACELLADDLSSVGVAPAPALFDPVLSHIGIWLCPLHGAQAA